MQVVFGCLYPSCSTGYMQTSTSHILRQSLRSTVQCDSIMAMDALLVTVPIVTLSSPVCLVGMISRAWLVDRFMGERQAVWLYCPCLDRGPRAITIIYGRAAAPVVYGSFASSSEGTFTAGHVECPRMKTASCCGLESSVLQRAQTVPCSEGNENSSAYELCDYVRVTSAQFIARVA